MIIVDAHEDLAWNSLTFGRDYLRSVAVTRSAEEGTQTPKRNGQTLIGWPEWVEGGVGVAFATLFASPKRHRLGDWDVLNYSDETEAHRLYWRQLDFYQRWVEQSGGKLQLVTALPELEQVCEARDRDGDQQDDASEESVGLVLLMEGADGIRQPGEVEAWFEAGVRIIGPAWSGTRYAGGTREPGPFSAEGRDLMEAMASVGMILDLSHLSDQGALEALDRYEGALIASHSNPRALLGRSKPTERHLSDEVIHRLAEREGVVGIVLANYFLKDGWADSDGREAVTLDVVADHIDHVCQLLGDAAHVGLGSDFDGGFGLDRVPKGLDSVADLKRIGDALQSRGYQLEAVEAILGGNWLSLLRRTLPES